MTRTNPDPDGRRWRLHYQNKARKKGFVLSYADRLSREVGEARYLLTANEDTSTATEVEQLLALYPDLGTIN